MLPNRSASAFAQSSPIRQISRSGVLRSIGAFRGCFAAPAARSALRRLPLIVLFVAPGVLSFLPACGGIDPGLSKNQQPIWRPSEYFSGAKIGYRTVYDRNGNVREVARIERTCESTPAEQRGVCTDRIDYGYATPDVSDTTRWSIHYITDQQSRVEYADGFGVLEGETLGAMMVLSGKRRLPGSAPVVLDSSGLPAADYGDQATVEIRMHLRPGAGRPMLQSELYLFLGFEIGRSDTLWLDR